MSEQTNDPRSDAVAGGAEFAADPTGSAATPSGGPAYAAGVGGTAETEAATRAGLGGPAAASGTAYTASATDAGAVESVDTRSPMQQGAQQVGDQATQGARDTMGTAKQEASRIASTATDQVRNLADQSRGELTDQARTQQHRLAGSLRDLGRQFGQMADSSDSSGMASDLARQASDQAHSLGSWLETHEPGDVVDEMKRFARRKPGTFLAVAAGLGFLSGRLTRSLTGGGQSDRPPSSRPVGRLDDGRYESRTAYDAATSTTTTYDSTGVTRTESRDPYYGTVGSDAELGVSTSGRVGQVSETAKPTATTAPAVPPGQATGSAWEEGER